MRCRVSLAVGGGGRGTPKRTVGKAVVGLAGRAGQFVGRWGSLGTPFGTLGSVLGALGVPRRGLGVVF